MGTYRFCGCIPCFLRPREGCAFMHTPEEQHKRCEAPEASAAGTVGAGAVRGVPCPAVPALPAFPAGRGGSWECWSSRAAFPERREERRGGSPGAPLSWQRGRERRDQLHPNIPALTLCWDVLLLTGVTSAGSWAGRQRCPPREGHCWQQSCGRGVHGRALLAKQERHKVRGGDCCSLMVSHKLPPPFVAITERPKPPETRDC